MLGIKTGCYWRICWKLITPILMIAILIYTIVTWENIKYQEYEYAPGFHGNFHSMFDKKVITE